MKFKELKVGDWFKWGDYKFRKIVPEMKTCCEVKFNAVRKDGKKVKFNKEDEVQ